MDPLFLFYKRQPDCILILNGRDTHSICNEATACGIPLLTLADTNLSLHTPWNIPFSISRATRFSGAFPAFANNDSPHLLFWTAFLVNQLAVSASRYGGGPTPPPLGQPAQRRSRRQGGGHKPWGIFP